MNGSRSASAPLLHAPVALPGWLELEFGDFAMLRRMLRGIKQRAERRPSDSNATNEQRRQR